MLLNNCLNFLFGPKSNNQPQNNQTSNHALLRKTLARYHNPAIFTKVISGIWGQRVISKDKAQKPQQNTQQTCQDIRPIWNSNVYLLGFRRAGDDRGSVLRVLRVAGLRTYYSLVKNS